MFTMSRLDSAYESAFRIEYNENSKFILFSDIHRGDNSISDEFAHNQNIYLFALQHYFKEGYTYVEVGDGDELWEHSKFDHIRYAHSDIFELLKNFHDDNRFIMLFGNHNNTFRHSHMIQDTLFHFYDEYDEFFDNLFPNIEVHEAVILENKKLNQEIFIVHGHQGDLINDQLWPFMRFLSRHFWRYFHIVGFRNPASPAKNAHKRHSIERNYTKWINKNKKILIAGHTHRRKYPRRYELPYFNTGCCIHPRYITGLEILANEISLIEWRIEPDKNGVLTIKKRTIRGPRPIEDFMIR